MEQPIEKYYTYADYLSWEDDIRAEIIYGELFMMSPAPLNAHQTVSMNLSGAIWEFLKDKPCQVFHAPFDVRLFENEVDSPNDVDTVVQPDILVVCDKSKLDKRGCKGAPDLIIEILSRSTGKHDRRTKRELYQRAGVREYWIVDPVQCTVEVLLPLGENGNFKTSSVYSHKDTAKVNVLPGCEIDLSKVFPEEN